MSKYTFLWHDYETFDIKTYCARPAQFAAIRTDEELNEIEEPITIYCKPASDFLPNPQSCLITGITPQMCLEHGISEYQFATQIESAMLKPGTITVGYNNICFDDEITRFMFWRNLIDPYAREWKNNCGRWDLLNVIRTIYALRPNSLQWPLKADGSPSFKLEELAKANNLANEFAHDALCDVRTTIALARLVRTQQPRLFNFCFALHKKERVIAEINLPIFKPFLYVSGIFPAAQGCLALMLPLSIHPTNKNGIIVFDLSYNPTELLTLSMNDICTILFDKKKNFLENTNGLPIQIIYVNRSPIIISNIKALSLSRATALNIDIKKALKHANKTAIFANLRLICLNAILQQYKRKIVLNVDEDLYGSGFISNKDRYQLTKLRALSPQQLAKIKIHFEDIRLKELFFRYRARNFPDSLSENEARCWEKYRVACLINGQVNTRTISILFEEINQLLNSVNERGKKILKALYNYAVNITQNTYH